MNYVNAGPLTLVSAGLWFAAWLWAAAAFGSFFVGRAFRSTSPKGVWLDAIFSVSAGLFILSIAVFLIGISGFLNRAAMIVLLVIGLLASRPIFLLVSQMGAEMKNIAVSAKPIYWLLGYLFLFLAITSFIAAAAPVTGNDALAYHLYFPRLYAESGQLFYDPTHARSLWPAFMGMLFSLGLVCQGTALAALFSWVTAILGMLSVPAAAYYYFGLKEAKTSSVFIFFIPVIWMQSVYPYVDSAVLLFSFLSFLALWRWMEEGYSFRAARLAGLCLAGLISIKYNALIVFFIFLFLFGVTTFRDKHSWRKKISSLTLLLMVVLLAAGFWYGRSWIHTGHPVFPFLAGWFGGHGYPQPMVGAARFPKNPLSFLLTPWNLAFYPKAYGGEPVGALFLAGLPLLFYFKRSRGPARAALFFSFLFLAAWFFSKQHARFILPLAPALSLGLGALAVEWKREAPRFFKRAATLSFVAIVALQAVLCFYYASLFAPAGLGLVPPGQFLEKRERSFGFIQKIKPFLSAKDKLLVVLEPRLFYVPAKTVYLSPTLVYLAKKEGVTFDEWLKKERVTHLVTLTRKNIHANSDYFKGMEFSADATKIVSHETAMEGDVFYYTLWKLDWRKGGQLRSVETFL